jgi:hypothetical protein
MLINIYIFRVSISILNSEKSDQLNTRHQVSLYYYYYSYYYELRAWMHLILIKRVILSITNEIDIFFF